MTQTLARLPRWWALPPLSLILILMIWGTWAAYQNSRAAHAFDQMHKSWQTFSAISPAKRHYLAIRLAERQAAGVTDATHALKALALHEHLRRVDYPRGFARALERSTGMRALRAELAAFAPEALPVLAATAPTDLLTVFQGVDRINGHSPRKRPPKVAIYSGGGMMDTRFYLQTPDAFGETLIILTHGDRGVMGADLKGKALPMDLFWGQSIRALLRMGDVLFVHRPGFGETALTETDNLSACNVLAQGQRQSGYLSDAALFARQFGYEKVLLAGEGRGAWAAMAATAQSDASGVWAFNPQAGGCDVEKVYPTLLAWSNRAGKRLTLFVNKETDGLESPVMRQMLNMLPAYTHWYEAPGWGQASHMGLLWSDLWIDDALARRVGVNSEGLN